MTPSRPAASKLSSHFCASLPHRASSARGGSRRATRSSSAAPLLERLLVDRLAVPEQQVEDDEVGRDLRRQLAHARLRRVQPHLHRVEVEDAVACDHDLAVERGVGRQAGHRGAAAPGSSEAAGRPLRDQSASSSPSFSSTPRKPSHFGSNCQPSVSGSALTSCASIGGKGTFGPGTARNPTGVDRSAGLSLGPAVSGQFSQGARKPSISRQPRGCSSRPRRLCAPRRRASARSRSLKRSSRSGRSSSATVPVERLVVASALEHLREETLDPPAVARQRRVEEDEPGLLGQGRLRPLTCRTSNGSEGRGLGPWLGRVDFCPELADS